MNPNSFYDEYKMPNPYMGQRSENGILFMIEEYFLSKILNKHFDDSHFEETIEAHKVSKGLYAQTPWNLKDPASHDNLTAIVCYWYQTDKIDKIRELRVIGNYLHPRDIVFYFWCMKGIYRVFSYILFWFLIVAQLSSYRDIYKKRPHGTFLDTDGKLLAWIRMRATMKDSISMRLCYKICAWIIKDRKELFDHISQQKHDLSNFGRLFMFYFKVPENPCHALGREYSNDLDM